MGEPVIVVGAGPGGLAAAWRLRRAGHPVRILEADHKVGGRMQSIRRDGYIVDRAASIIPDVYSNILDIVAEAGLADELVPGGSIIGFAKPDGIHYLDSARLYLEAPFSQVLSWRSKLMMLRMFLDNRRFEPLMSYEDLSIAAHLDTESATEYADRRVTPEIRDYVIDAAIRAILGTRAKDVSVLEFFFSFNKVFGSKLMNFRGGMGSYPELLAGKFDDVVLNARVVSVEESPAEVTVTWVDGSGAEHVERAAGCVCALPGDRSAAVVAGLDPWRRQFLGDVDYTPTVSINAGLAAPPDIPGFVVQVPYDVQDELMCVVMEHHKAPGRVPPGKGGLTTYTMAEAAADLMHDDDDTAAGKVLGWTENVIGKLPDVDWVQVNRWQQVVVRSYPGYYKQVGEFMKIRRERDRRVQIAGDFYSSSNANTATASGEAAARDLLAALGPSTAAGAPAVAGAR
jgi:oxygen-dependent protoporphyrinogen oxidase